MASTYSSTLNLELQASGENSGTWGTITNNNLQKIESAVKGYVSVAIASTSDSLTASDGTTGDEQSNAIIKLTGTLTGNTTFANPSNISAGQSGVLFITQDGTGSTTAAFGSYWDFSDGTAPTLSTGANLSLIHI